jgi:shikimate dehydrogenase
VTDAVLRHLVNAPDLGATPRYAGIVGERPSKGARSPSLWNAVFAAERLDIRFHPFDVDGPALAPVVAALKADERFIGGSVAVPHKTALLALLDQVEPAAQLIGAVNALYRDGPALVGANTDGAAALSSLHRRLGVDNLGQRTVLLLGTGGAGAAVAAYIAGDLDKSGRLLLANRDGRKTGALAARLGPVASVVDWPAPRSALSAADVLVNCTSVGFAPAGGGSATALLTSLATATDPATNFKDSLAAVAALPTSALVFDIVYLPRVTMLMQIAAARGLETLGGLEMNQEQAVMAFARAVPGVAPDRVRTVMAAVG